MNAPPVVVMKLGGSLLTLPDLDRRLESLVAQRSDMRPVIICGGGAAVDLVRQAQSRHGLSDEAAHWLALRAVTLNEALVARLLPRATSVGNGLQLSQAWEEHLWPIVCAETWLQNDERSGRTSLPHHWDVTSDSIAAWVALQIPASELALLKSVELPREASVIAAAKAGFVDRYLPRLDTSTLRLSWVNLRAPRPSWSIWQQSRRPVDA